MLVNNLRWFFLIFPATYAFPQNMGADVRSAGLAGVHAMLPEDRWASCHNPAGLALLSESAVSVCSVPSAYGLTELRTYSVSGAARLVGHAVGFRVEQFGFDLYRETIGTAAYGIGLGNELYAGIALNAHHTSIKGYGSTNTFLVSGGCIAHFEDGLFLGIVAENIMGETIGTIHQPLPQILSLGLAYQADSVFTLTAEAEKENEYDVIVKAGIEIDLLRSLVLRAGISNNPDRVSAGFSLRYAGLEFGYAMRSHSDLGWEHHFEFSARLGS